MKNHLLFVFLAFLLTFTGPASAQSYGDDPFELCADVARTFKTLMTARQNGITMDVAVEVARKNNVTLTAVQYIYNYPLYSTEADKEEAIRYVHEHHYKGCLEDEGVSWDNN